MQREYYLLPEAMQVTIVWLLAAGGIGLAFVALLSWLVDLVGTSQLRNQGIPDEFMQELPKFSFNPLKWL